MADPRPSRRETLQALSALAGARLLGGCAPEGTAETPPAPEPLHSVRRHVIVMMENRSFDHYFGSLSLDEGRSEVNGLGPGMTNPDAAGALVASFALDRDCLEDPPHGWSSSHAQFAEGANDGFVRIHHDGLSEVAREVMGYYGRRDLPVYYALADDNALCQAWHASVMGPTWPNRFYSACGTSDGWTSNDFDAVPFPRKSIFKQLDEAGISWKIYFSEIPFQALIDDVKAFGDDGHVVFIEEFYRDCAEGTLPEVAWIEPGYTFNDDHPPHAIALGQVFIGTLYKALAESPQWGESLMIVDYDEHGGFYDHVAPPKTEDDHAEQGFDQLGFRIPALVLGPYAKVGVVDTQYDHTSVLKQLQVRYGLEPLTRRNEVANDLSDCLDWERLASQSPRPPTPLPLMEVDEEQLRTACVGLAQSGQPELEHLCDIGVIPPAFDARSRREEVIARMLVRAEKGGLLRVKGGR
jgi:phospholipase C